MEEPPTSPVIGITVGRRPSSFGGFEIEADVVPATYARAVEAVGGKPLLLPAGCCGTLLDLVDGLVVEVLT